MTQPSSLPRRAADGPGIVLAGTLDTKSDEIGFVCENLEARGHRVIVIDCGVLGEPRIPVTITRTEIARAGGGDIAALRSAHPRAVAISVMIKGLEAQIRRLAADGLVEGFLGIGGGTNAAFAAAAFRALPFGVPKMLVSTVACGNTRPFIGIKDVLLMHSVVDVLGLNSFLREILMQAASALSGMVREAAGHAVASQRGSCIAITSYGCTNEAASHAIETLAEDQFEVLAFHARGVGGEAMEAMVREGRIRAVLDLTTTEIADEIVGGICSAGPDRLRAAGEAGIPQVVLPGAIDVVNFGPPATVPPQFADRSFVSHTPLATLMRTTPAENAEIGAFVARRLNQARGPVGVVIPLRGFSAYDCKGHSFFDPIADAAFVETLTRDLDPRITVERVDAHINDRRCVDVATAMLRGMIGDHHSQERT